MEDKKKYAFYLVAFSGVFLASAVVFRVFNFDVLPAQLFGALIGVFITAIVTAFLLRGQSESQEMKERNVKVFEKKTEVFNNFIEELWKCWEDRDISLEELADLFKLVSKSIIPYAKPENSERILKELNKLAEFAKSVNERDKTKGKKEEIQSSVFEIINILSNEIGLGGKITPEIRSQLNDLEKNILPVLDMKNFKASFFKNLKNFIAEENLKISSIYPKENTIWCDICFNNETPIYLVVSDIEREDTNKPVSLSFYIDELFLKQFSNFREASRGWKRNHLKGIKWGIEGIVNLGDIKQIENISSEEAAILSEEAAKTLSNEIVEYYKGWSFDNKNVEQIIVECIND